MYTKIKLESIFCVINFQSTKQGSNLTDTVMSNELTYLIDDDSLTPDLTTMLANR
jgi:hypothetical protein